MFKRGMVVRWIVVMILAFALPLLSAFGWPQFNLDAQHSGDNTQEVLINPSNVGDLSVLFQVSLPGNPDGAPVFLQSASTISGTRDLLFVTTTDGHIAAIDARTGEGIWSHQNGPGLCRINSGISYCYTTSSPAVDPNRQFVYSYGLDGYVHKYRVGNGAEVTGGGWPELTTLKGFDEKGSSPLSIATAQNGTSYLYVTHSGYPGDAGDYQGHLTAINLTDGTQHVFNTLCSNQTVHLATAPATPNCPDVQSGVWSRANVVYSPANNRIYLSTGNAVYDPAQHDWADSVLALNPDGTGVNGGPLDSYTPSNYQTLQNQDADLGSTNVAILPVAASSTVQHLAVQGGKDAKLRLLNLDNLSGQGGPGHTGGEVGTVINVPQGGEVLTAPAVWVNPADGSTWVFIANDNGISGLQVTYNASHVPALTSRWQRANGGTSPIVAGRVLYYASSGIIRGLNPTTGNTLWSSTQIGRIHWHSPILANGILYIADQSGTLTAFSRVGVLPPPVRQVFVPLVWR